VSDCIAALIRLEMSRTRSAAVDGSNAADNHAETDAVDVPGSRGEPPHIMGIIGADPVGVQGSGPHKNLVVGSSVARTPTKILLKEI